MSSASQLFHEKPITLTVFGHPQPQGSSKAFIPKGWKRAVITSDNKNLKSWRQELTAAALEAVNGRVQPIFGKDVPVEITMRFYFTRPASATLKKRPGMTVKPDGDKLQRAIQDSLKGVIVNDDSQFIEWHGRKMYGGPERVEIEIREAIA